MDAPPVCTDIVIEHVAGDHPALDCRDRHIVLTAPPAADFPADLYHLIYGVTRKALLDRGYYCVHAACVGTGDDFRLVAGHSGAGKTTLAHRLVEQHGMKLLSGNKTVVRFDADGGMIAVAGTRTMTAVDRNLNRYAYDMADTEYATGEVRIKAVDIVRINDGVAEVQRLSLQSALHTLYPYFMDTVNADIIVNGRDIFDGTPSVTAKTALAQGLHKAAVPVRKISGTMDFMTREVLRP